ncbi:FORMATE DEHYDROGENASE 1 [Salix purpurea]|uniref:FORMATE DEHYDROGENASE 1 n=1 Tax=Salix purpurea TaxID=77065 RepID=A0A9Q0SRR2_SALPP|nr:FORMATE DEHYDROGENASE 1 [Salix purpurea]
MEGPYEASSNGEAAKSNLQIIRYSPFKPCSKFTSPWFDLRVFYVRISNFQVDDLTPQFLTLSHIPQSPDTLLEINGSRTSMYSDGIAALLRRDRVDKKSKEATFVSTDSIRTTGSVEFEVLDGKDLVLSGVLEMSNNNGCTGESKSSVKQWRMNCDSHITIGTGFLKGKYNGGPNSLTHKKHNRKGILDSIPEYETAESTKKTSPDHDLQVVDNRICKLENEEDYSNMYWRRNENMDGEDCQLSWFNAGVRVGVGLGLGICLGIGVGVGLLVRTYKATTHNFKRRPV